MQAEAHDLATLRSGKALQASPQPGTSQRSKASTWAQQCNAAQHDDARGALQKDSRRTAAEGRALARWGATCHLLRQLPKAARHEICMRAEGVSSAQGHVVVRRGEHLHSLLFLFSGTACVLRDDGAPTLASSPSTSPQPGRTDAAPAEDRMVLPVGACFGIGHVLGTEHRATAEEDALSGSHANLECSAARCEHALVAVTDCVFMRVTLPVHLELLRPASRPPSSCLCSLPSRPKTHTHTRSQPAGLAYPSPCPTRGRGREPVLISRALTAMLVSQPAFVPAA